MKKWEVNEERGIGRKQEVEMERGREGVERGETGERRRRECEKQDEDERCVITHHTITPLSHHIHPPFPSFFPFSYPSPFTPFLLLRLHTPPVEGLEQIIKRVQK